MLISKERDKVNPKVEKKKHHVADRAAKYNEFS